METPNLIVEGPPIERTAFVNLGGGGGKMIGGKHNKD